MSSRHGQLCWHSKSWADAFCCESQQPQLCQEGKSLAEDHRGVRIGNGRVQTMRTLFPHPLEGNMASTWPEGEAPLHSSQKRQLTDAKARGSFPSPQPFLGCLDVAARAAALTWQTWPGLHQVRRASPSRGSVAIEGHPLPGTPGACLYFSSHSFPNQNSHYPQTASPFVALQKEWVK